MTKNITDYVKKIDDVAVRLPSLPKRERKNLFDIMGVSTKETINSKLLAYFFDPNEEHGFGTLFFDALIEILSEKTGEENKLNSYEGTFEVATEVMTSKVENEEDQYKRIDVSIIGDNWYIIIENKLYHHLQNPLETYHQHAQNLRAHVQGVVLSLNSYNQDECKQNGIDFLNVTHQELINKVQANLILSRVENDTDIFYLREYFKTINSNYNNDMNEPQFNKLVSALVEQRDAVNDIINKKIEAVKYIDKQIHEVFIQMGYEYSKPWFCHPTTKNLRFWVTPGVDILSNNNIGIAFEIWDDLIEKLGAKKLSEIHKELESRKMPQFFIDNIYNKPNRMKRIITYRGENFLKSESNFKTELSIILNDYFFNSNGIENVVLKQLSEIE